MKEARQKWEHIVWFYLHRIQKADQIFSREAEQGGVRRDYRDAQETLSGDGYAHYFGCSDIS